MEIKQARFVEMSAVCKNYPLASELFYNSDVPFSYGDNNHSLVSVRDLIQAMDKLEFDINEEGVQICEVIRKLHTIPNDVYIDLEN